jgi:predicted metal-binding membrane protein
VSAADAGIAARPPRPTRIVPALLLCSAAAWLTLVAVSSSSRSAVFEHGALEDLGAHRWQLATLAAGWVLMLAAMMLPTSLPLFALFARLTAARTDRRLLMAMLVGVYMVVWAAVGGAMYVADLGVHRLVDSLRWLEVNAWAISAGTLAFAGVYQLSALKQRCATRCRTPQSFIRAHWRGAVRGDTMRLAFDHAASCVGCCWALMLVMFSVGVGSIAWMAALTAVMIAEKTSDLGPRLRAPVAIWLIVGALLTAIAG